MIGVELRKLALRPRVWLSIGLLCLLPALVAVLLSVSDLAPPPGQGGAFLSAVLRNGALYPAAALAMVLPVFLPLAVAVFAGDAIAGEAATGTLRYLLVRPVARPRVLVAKLVALAVFTVLAVLVVAVTSLVVGLVLFGTGAEAVGQASAATSLSGIDLSPGELAVRMAAAIGYIVVSMVGFGSIALFFSTLSDSAIGAALAALAVLIASSIMETLQAAAAIKPYLPTNYWLSWIDFFRDPVFWDNIDKGLLLQAGYIVLFFGAAWANFASKDITS
ncbi:ABC transporter permease [Umezawaea tangerina]|uniref:ABC-2 type transport system permease protein n=1 Tax=Umezawaea tangerina TaxID=84725 RepID=A0A2T0TH40_9PSEU|nr:ABC transporter permease [Umezawaea tangerina]PRY45016.1 ABC-2 type transport system permease protein [Umezawaea tangerina]